ncbi:Etoposide-induced protein 2.4 (EI24) [Duganella sp. CF458]|uniref:EI24 domain-containing protein n=1 Tax=Duganella sp. CF458 TaxID=1884368 RepID=UPI0008E9F5AF|nr:EI24 domain-containing protein [Duganella sp. CF458]SFG00573.1 Etoposide-induced protein 2.4 (EI24) [Duganella sp. CF458]
MRAVIHAYGRALLSQLHGKILLLSIVPFILSVALWALLLWLGLQPLLDWLHGHFVDFEIYRVTSDWLQSIGLAGLRSIVVPLFALLLLLPLMIVTAMIFIGVAAMPFIVRHVGGRHFPQLEKKQGGSILGGVIKALGAFGIFVLAWLCILPMYIFPPLAGLATVLLWGWLTSRVMSYDALADYASAEELAKLQREHRWQLMSIGVVSGLAGSLPALVWVGGAAAAIAFFPILLAASIWVYVVIFIFTGLWFQYYCLQALAQLRHAPFEESLCESD